MKRSNIFVAVLTAIAIVLCSFSFNSTALANNGIVINVNGGNNNFNFDGTDTPESTSTSTSTGNTSGITINVTPKEDSISQVYLSVNPSNFKKIVANGKNNLNSDGYAISKWRNGAVSSYDTDDYEVGYAWSCLPVGLNISGSRNVYPELIYSDNPAYTFNKVYNYFVQVCFFAKNGKKFDNNTKIYISNNGVQAYKRITDQVLYVFIPVSFAQDSYTSDYSSDAYDELEEIEIIVVKMKKNVVQLNWKKLKKADKYAIYCSVDDGSMKKVTTIKKNKYKAKKLKKNTKYVYQVEALRKGEIIAEGKVNIEYTNGQINVSY